MAGYELRYATAVLAVVAAVATTSLPAAADSAPTAPADFVALRDVDPSILSDIRYITPHNFTGDPVDGYLAPMCILTRPPPRHWRGPSRTFAKTATP